MQIRDPPKIGISLTKDNTSRFIDITDKQVIIFVEFDYIVQISGMSKKRINLYLFRHPEIKTHKLGKTKYVSIQILEYLFRNLGEYKTSS